MDTPFQQILTAFSDLSFMVVPFAILLGLAAVAAIYRRPAIGACLILASAPLEGFLMVGGSSIAKMATLLCVGVFVARILLITKGFKIDSTAIILFAFLAWTFASILWSPQHEASLSMWISFALSTSLYLVLINFVASRGDLKMVIWAHVIGGSILAFLLISAEIAQEFQRKDEVAGLGLNLAARLAVLNTLLALFLFQSETAKLKKVVLLVAMVLSFIGSVVSLSRGAWLSLALALVALGAVYLIMGRVRIKLSYVVISLVVVFATISILNQFVFDAHGAEKLTMRFESGINLSDDAGGRLDIWQVGWTMFSDAPLAGHGFDSFGYYYHFYSGTGGLGIPSPEESKAPHNSFVGVLVQFGVIGIALFLAIAVIALGKSWVTWSTGSRSSFALGWVVALAVFLVAANFVDYAVDRKYLWYVLGLIALIAQYAGEEEKARITDVANGSAQPAAKLRLRELPANR